MGNIIAKLIEKIIGTKEIRVLMLGLDNAGKTSKLVVLTIAILYKLKFHENNSLTVPTIGFNVECITYKNIKFNVWDVGGQNKIRPLWRHYFTGTKALIFVVDCSDRDRIEEAKQEFTRIVSDREMHDCITLILANKQDILNCIILFSFLINLALCKEDLTKIFNFEALESGNWFIQPCCATTEEGLYDGLDWLVRKIKQEL